jgi:hypothetical protein
MSNAALDVVRDTLGTVSTFLLMIVTKVCVVIDMVVFGVDKTFGSLVSRVFSNPLFLVLLLLVIWLINAVCELCIRNSISNSDTTLLTMSISGWLFAMWFMMVVMSLTK